jgi:hypothetical protein
VTVVTDQQPRPWLWTAVGIAALPVLFWFVFLRGSGEPARDPAQAYVDEYGGSRIAIEAILGYTDCATLQRTFEDADANREAFGVGSDRSREQLGRMAAADDRMDELGC